MEPSLYAVLTYALYLPISIVLTVWVGRTLHAHGRVFLLDSFPGKEALADAVNHLLLVGFYLVNIGYVTLALKSAEKPGTLVEAIEFLSHKVGLVLVVLGVMHFLNVFVIARWRRRAHQHPLPPVEPDLRLDARP